MYHVFTARCPRPPLIGLVAFSLLGVSLPAQARPIPRYDCCDRPFLLAGLSGTATLQLDNNSQYEGELLNGKFDGQGILTQADGTRYEGSFKKGKYDGPGSLTLPDGSRYEGRFLRGQYHGEGELTRADGSRYQGEFSNGVYNGKGQLTKPDGKTYSGGFVDGKYSGQGELIYADGSRYIGKFLEGDFNGIGVFILPDGTRLVANWQNGKRLDKSTDAAAAANQADVEATKADAAPKYEVDSTAPLQSDPVSPDNSDLNDLEDPADTTEEFGLTPEDMAVPSPPDGPVEIPTTPASN